MEPLSIIVRTDQFMWSREENPPAVHFTPFIYQPRSQDDLLVLNGCERRKKSANAIVVGGQCYIRIHSFRSGADVRVRIDPGHIAYWSDSDEVTLPSNEAVEKWISGCLEVSALIRQLFNKVDEMDEETFISGLSPAVGRWAYPNSFSIARHYSLPYELSKLYRKRIDDASGAYCDSFGREAKKAIHAEITRRAEKVLREREEAFRKAKREKDQLRRLRLEARGRVLQWIDSSQIPDDIREDILCALGASAIGSSASVLDP